MQVDTKQLKQSEFDFSSFCEFSTGSIEDHLSILNNPNFQDSSQFRFVCKIDNQQLSTADYKQRFASECLPFFYTSWAQDTTSTTTTIFKPSLNSYTQDYFLSHQIDSEYAELTKGDNDILYLSLSSTNTGPMESVVYDLNSCSSSLIYNSTSYNGNYYLGHSMNGKEFTNTRLIYKIGNHLGYKDFILEPYNSI